MLPEHFQVWNNQCWLNLIQWKIKTCKTNFATIINKWVINNTLVSDSILCSFHHELLWNSTANSGSVDLLFLPLFYFSLCYYKNYKRRQLMLFYQVYFIYPYMRNRAVIKLRKFKRMVLLPVLSVPGLNQPTFSKTTCIVFFFLLGWFRFCLFEHKFFTFCDLIVWIDNVKMNSLLDIPRTYTTNC